MALLLHPMVTKSMKGQLGTPCPKLWKPRVILDAVVVEIAGVRVLLVVALLL